jgi:hypothetical protein
VAILPSAAVLRFVPPICEFARLAKEYLESCPEFGNLEFQPGDSFNQSGLFLDIRVRGGPISLRRGGATEQMRPTMFAEPGLPGSLMTRAPLLRPASSSR